MTFDEIADMVRQDLAVVLGIDPAEIENDTSFDDLEIDSIDIVEVVGLAERKLSIEIQEQRFNEIRKFSQLVAIIEEKVSAKAP